MGRQVITNCIPEVFVHVSWRFVGKLVPAMANFDITGTRGKARRPSWSRAKIRQHPVGAELRDCPRDGDCFYVSSFRQVWGQDPSRPHISLFREAMARELEV